MPASLSAVLSPLPLLLNLSFAPLQPEKWESEVEITHTPPLYSHGLHTFRF